MSAPSVGDGKPRLVIKRLELENFKSYAGIQHIGPFHKNLSAIMGPNGSGKSNVIDAMLFVFGKRAKQSDIYDLWNHTLAVLGCKPELSSLLCMPSARYKLRLSKVSELIHNSTHHQNLQQAKAQDIFETIPNSDLVVSRTASKDNTSQYQVNGKKASAKEVVDLLKSKGIDLENSRFLILQGEVEQISLMKPKGEDENDGGLLEYLEDIVGTRHYVEHISKAATQLEEFSEERRKHLQLVKVAQSAVDILEDEKEAAEAYRQNEAEYYCLKINILKWNRIRCMTNVETIGTQLEELEKKKQYEEGKLAQHSEELKQLEDKAKEKDDEVKKLKKDKDNAETAIRKLKESQATNDKKQEHAMKKRDAAAIAHKSKLQKLTESERQLEDAQQEVPVAEAEVQQKQDCINGAQGKLEEMLEGVQDECVKVQQRLTTARTAAAPWRSKLQSIQQERDMVATKADLLRKSVLASSKRHEEVTAELEISENELETNKARLKALKSSREAHKVQSREKSAALESAKKVVATSEAAVSEARSVLQGLASAMASAKTQGQLAKALADAHSNGDIRGLYGRLGDLGSIDAEFDAAASNASGALDNFVVETTEDAQAAVKYLRDKRLGLATFIILDKQRQYQAQVNEKVKTPENAPRLVDLVKCEDEMRVAFFYAFRNTLVAKDIDQASRLGLYGKDRRFARVVTLQGELVAENGTMSGGGNRVTRGKMRLGSSAPVGAQQSQRDCVEAEAKLQKLEKQLEHHQHAVNQLEAAVKEEQDTLQPLCVQVQKEEMAVESLFRKVADLRQQLKKIKTEMTQISKGDAELRQFEEAVVQHDAEIERVKEDAAGAEAEVARVEQELHQVGGPPIQEQRNQVEVLKKDVQDAQDTVKKQKANIESLKKSIKIVTAEMKKKLTEVAALDKELSDYQSSSENVASEQFKLQQSVEETTKCLNFATEELQEVSKEVKLQSEKQAVIEEVVENLLCEFNDRNEMLKQESDKVNEIDGKIAAMQEELESILSSVESLTASEVKSEEEIADMTEEQRQKIETRLSFLDGQMEQDRKKIDLKVLEKYKQKKGELDNKQTDLADVTSKRDEARSEHDDLRKKRLEEFMHGFGIISSKLQEIYQMITIGGDAELNVVDSLDPFSEGIVFEVRPPKKSWKNIRNLSGGEKTLSSLALVFALHHYKPTPLYFMDEIDAALDFKNVSIVANYIKAQTRNAQFVVISLRNHMFELADRLMGIYKVQNCTSSLTIEPHRLCYGKAANSLQDRPVLQQQRA